MNLNLISEERERILSLHKTRKEVLLFETIGETPKFNIIDTFDLKTKDGKNFGKGRILLMNYKDQTGKEIVQTALDVNGKTETLNIFYQDGKIKSGPLTSGVPNFAKILGFNADNMFVYNDEIAPLLTQKFSDVVQEKSVEIPKLTDVKTPVFNTAKF